MPRARPASVLADGRRRLLAAGLLLLLLTPHLAGEGECHRATFVLHGHAAFGEAIASLGDLDGDGTADYAGGAPAGDPGRVHIVSGRTASLLHTIAGPGRSFGAALASLGTRMAGNPPAPEALLAVGAPCSGSGRGGVALYVVRAAEAERLFLVTGDADERLGTALGSVQSAVGPLVIAGAPGWSGGSGRTGRVLLLDLDGAIRSQTAGERDGEGYGAAVAGAGDVDGDGEADVLVGSQDPRPGGDAAGRITLRRQNGGLLLRLDGKGAERLGGAVARTGDLDGDGFGDFLAAASGFLASPPCGLEPPDGSGTGRVYVLRGGSRPVAAGGTLGAVLRTLADNEAGAFFGATLALLDDLDGDGARELAVGALLSTQRGRENSGRVDVFRGGDGTRLWSLGGHQAGDRLGLALDAAPDQDGDGAGDLLAASHREGGEVVLFSLGDGDQNGERDACEPCAVPEDLGLNDDATFALTRVARRRCFRIQPPTGASIRVRVLAAAEGDSAVLFLRWGAPPEPTLFHQSTTGGADESPGLFIRAAPPVPGYIVVQAGKLRSRSADFRLEVESITGPTLFAMTPPRSVAGSSGDLFASVHGAALPPEIHLALRPAGGGDAQRALETLRLSPFRASARFDLRDTVPGAYDLVAFAGQAEVAALPAALKLSDGPGRHAHRVALRGPRLYRNNSLGRATLRLENVGDSPLTPPLFEVAGLERTTLGFPRAPGEFAERLQGLARSPLTPDGSLPPGSRIDIPIWFRRPADCAPDSDDCALELALFFFEPRPEARIEWEALPVPAGMTAADWSRALPVLSRLGSRWSDYHAALVDASMQLARRGQFSASALPAFQLAVRRALGLPSAAVTGIIRKPETGEPVANVWVVALAGEEPMAYAPTNGQGFFVLDWLENGAEYRFEVVLQRTGAVLQSGPTIFRMPDEGDVLGVEIEVGPPATGQVITPACPPCEAAALPLAPLSPPRTSFTRRASFSARVLSSFDPNEKNGSGTQGGGSEIDPEEAIAYQIYFENLIAGENAAAARKVEITDVLAPELDWTTVELGDAVVESQPAGILVDLGADGGGFQDFSADSGLGVDPSSSAPTDASFAAARWTGEIQYRHDDPQVTAWVDLHIAATVEPAAQAFVEGGDQGVVTWSFRAAEVEDDVPPDGVPRDAGFLAHGCAEAASGETSSCGGHVSFTVEPVIDLAEGTPIINDADIVFDGLESVLTDPASTVTVASQPPGVPAFPYPEDADPAVPGGEIHLSWEAAYATTADVYLWSASAGESRPTAQEEAIVWEPGLPGTRYPGDGGTFSLPADGSWRWQVVARNERGELAEGPVWRFTTSTTGALFKRGDADGSGALQITDAIFALGFLFLGGEPPACLETADADDSGNLNITDPILTLTYLFVGGAEIPAPGPEACGADLTPDSAALPGADLGCAVYGACA